MTGWSACSSALLRPQYPDFHVFVGAASFVDWDAACRGFVVVARSCVLRVTDLALFPENQTRELEVETAMGSNITV